jgi:hypothetical protein
MQTAAAALEYERAGALRDRREALCWLHDHLDRLRRARDRQTFVYPIVGADGVEVWYLIRRGWVAATVARPTDSPSARAAQERIADVFEHNRPWAQPSRVDGIDGVLLVASWFKRYPAERERVLEPDLALALCRQLARSVDGSPPPSCACQSW